MSARIDLTIILPCGPVGVHGELSLVQVSRMLRAFATVIDEYTEERTKQERQPNGKDSDPTGAVDPEAVR